MLNDRQRFKAAFMGRCIECGYTTPEQMVDRVKAAKEKLRRLDAVEKQAGIGKTLAETGGKAFNTALSWSIPLALAAPPIAGYAVGNLAGKAQDLDDTDIDEIKKRELIDELRRQTAYLKKRRQRTDTPAGGRAL